MTETESGARVLASGEDALILLARILELHARLMARVLADCEATAWDAAPVDVEPDTTAAELRALLLPPTVH